jgi:hypothetical protein
MHSEQVDLSKTYNGINQEQLVYFHYKLFMYYELSKADSDREMR